MRNQDKGWIAAISSGDAGELWSKLFELVSKHSAVRNLYFPNRFSYDRFKDIYCDLTQDLFLRLYVKGRWQYYLDAEYKDEGVEHEIQHIEIPNLVSSMLREHFPESYRLARRTSILLQTRSEFRRYDRVYRTSRGLERFNWTRPNKKLALQIYGLRKWGFHKPLKCEQEITELAKEVAFRNRNTRRTGRGSGSQVIISNEELSQLMVDIFTVIDSPVDVRTLRQLVLSKLTIEDSRFISIDAPVRSQAASEKEIPQVELADERPTPEAELLEKEASSRAEAMADEALQELKRAVRNKPQRYSKLIEVIWHCYYNPSRPTQTEIARLMNISASLVSHYRKLSESVFQDLMLSLDDMKLLNITLGERLKKMIGDSKPPLRAPADSAKEQSKLFQIPNKAMTVAASVGFRR